MDRRQWSKAAWALALLFGSFPVVGRMVLGNWEFGGSAEIACLLFAGRRLFPFAQPPAIRRESRSGNAARPGQPARRQRPRDRAVALLTKTIRQSPKLWQAYQYRGELHLRLGNAALAAHDFSEAIRLAPNEPHLYLLREQAHALLGDDR